MSDWGAVWPDPEDRSQAARNQRYEILAEFELTPRHQRADRGMPVTQGELAEMFGVTSGAVSQWKKSIEFNRIMSRLVRRHFGPQRLKEVMDNVYETALGSTPQAMTAAKLFMTYSQQAEQTVDLEEEIAELSDDDLIALVEARRAKLEG